MVNIADLVPTMETIIKRARTRTEKEPEAENIDRMKYLLESMEYEPKNETLYNGVVRYGAREYSRYNQKGLFLRGSVGIGKSFALEILAMEFNIPVFTPIILNGLFKECNGNLADIERVVNLNFFEHPFEAVAIDEIGSINNASNYGEKVNIVAEVLDMRYRAFSKYGSRTIATTNLNDKELLENYGLRIDDRLNEMFYFINANGESMRK